MAAHPDWYKLVQELRKSAANFLSVDNSAALLKCRKSMEVIQISLFFEMNGEMPSSFMPFEKMMSKKGIGDKIPKSVKIDFSTVNEWGNYGCHWQVDGEPNDKQVKNALSALDSLISWRFEEESTNLPSKTPANSSKSTKQNIITITNVGNMKKIFNKKYNVNDLFNYISVIDKNLKTKPKGSKKLASKVVSNPKNNQGVQNRDYGTIHLLMRAVELSGGKGNNWANLSEVGLKIKSLDPDFKVKNTGHSRLELLFRKHKQNFDMKFKNINDKKVVFVKVKESTDS